ncbi:hypothetical protein P1U19_22915 [Escherichia coli]
MRSNTTVGHRGTLTLAAGGSLSGRTQLSKGASMVLNGDVGQYPAILLTQGRFALIIRRHRMPR